MLLQASTQLSSATGAQQRRCFAPFSSSNRSNCALSSHASSSSIRQLTTSPASASHRSLRPSHVVQSAAEWLATYPLPTSQSLVMDVGGQQLKLETGEIGRQANGAIMATLGDTVIYTTACCSNGPTGDGSFVPFQVHYAERFSAAGRTSGGYLKRDGRPKDDEVLVSRLVDRPLRPMFPKGWANDTQVLQWVLSYDGVHPPEPLAITAAGAALLVSDIPLSKAVAGVRVGWLPDEGFVVNPSVAQMTASRLDLLVAGTRDAVLMIEGFCDFMSEEQMLQAIDIGAQAIASMCTQMEAWAAQVGQAKRTDLAVVADGLKAQVAELAATQLYELYRSNSNKDERGSTVSGLQTQVAAALGGEGGASSSDLMGAFKAVESDVMRQLILKEGKRADGRSVADIRPITSRAGLLPRTHGSVLFTRGETQSICVATLGTAADAQRLDTMRSGDSADSSERFYLQYFFPPSSVGETGRVGGPGRRELGHGELAQRALTPTVPDAVTFPYTVRVESTITESNGSSSMASVCGGCLAMMDAGVPVTRPVAGIAMGLILEPSGEFQVLSDILGSEDALGDMDFKVAGSADAITAFQMDIKVEGITLDIMRAALAQAGEGRRHILEQMAKCSPAPRGEVSPFAPCLMVWQMPDPSKRGNVIGGGGRTIKGVMEATGATNISIDDFGAVEIAAPSKPAAEAALEMVQVLADDIAPGRVFRARKVVQLATFGAFVEICPGKQGLVHVSELSTEHVADVAAEVKVGQLMDVLVLPNGRDGKLSLSRKAVLMLDSGVALEDVLGARAAAGESRPGTPGGSEGGRRRPSRARF